MKNRKTKERGITLIALVITIIVLLILAGVAVSMALNEGNLFAKANEAKTSWNRKVEEENGINDTLAYIEQYIDGEGGGLPEGWNDAAVADVVTETSEVEGVTKERNAPIPAGFKASIYEGETAIADGLVIYETNTELTADEGSSTTNHDSAMTTYNQYVWIPVDDINQMVMCKDNNIVEGANGSKICNLVLQTDGSLKCMTHHANDDETELCGRLYGTQRTTTATGTQSASNPFVYTTSMNFSNRNQTWDTTSSHEPDTTPYGTNGDASANGLAGVNSILGTSASSYDEATDTAWKTELTTNFNNMAKSVAKYGGFYIARYEAGYEAIPTGYNITTSRAAYTSKKGQVVMNASRTANKGANMWYGLYKQLRGKKEETNSTMIWGCQYDQVINFIGNEAQIGHTDRNLTSTANISSGSTEKDKMKNIYDLEGNYLEWTAEAKREFSRTFRGGVFYSVAAYRFYPASDREVMNPAYTDYGFSSRPALYL